MMENQEKILFCNVGWLPLYQGEALDQSKGVQIHGGGRYNKEKVGFEVYNFSPIDNDYYGYVEPSERIDIGNLGASSKDDSISGITVVWTAPHPHKEKGNFIVGWYQNATVFREKQEHSLDESRKGFNKYYIRASVGKSKRLDEGSRTFKVPRATEPEVLEGGMGQKNIWYAKDLKWQRPDGKLEDIDSFKERVREYIKDNSFQSVNRGKRGRVQDQDRKAEVERKAIAMCWTHFENQGYTLKTVEKDNVGWDLEAKSDKEFFRIEVKGLSGSNFSIGLTPNEYAAFIDKEERDRYRLAVVMNALSESPELNVCRYSEGNWLIENKRNHTLDIQEKTGASVTLKLRMSETDIGEKLETVGKAVFIECFDIFRRYTTSQITQEAAINEMWEKYPDKAESGCKACLSGAKAIFKKEAECVAIKMICESRNLSDDIIEKANILLQECAK